MDRQLDRSLKLLLVSTSVGPLGSGLGGGVELTLHNLAKALQQRGHTITVVAPTGSVSEFPLVEIPGMPQITAQTEGRNAWIAMPGDSVLANMWDYARQVQGQYDLLINFAYDWLPFYLTPFFQPPIAHLVSMSSYIDAMDQVMGQVAARFPGTIAMHSRVQAATFPFGDRVRSLGNGFDMSLYEFCAKPQPYLGWIGRISPEKGLEDAILAAQKTGIPLKIWGVVQDVPYWHAIQEDYPDAPFSYEGFLPTQALQHELGKCQALLLTSRLVESFGNVAIEALACGVPVIAYRRGGPVEILEDGQTGWLVEPDSVLGLVAAIGQLGSLSRDRCRQRAEQEYSLTAFGDRLEQWMSDILTQHPHNPTNTAQ